ncbi:MAG: AmmeMemoRadiSam system protein B [Candidatus Micrarchaeia archaeon]
MKTSLLGLGGSIRYESFADIFYTSNRKILREFIDKAVKKAEIDEEIAKGAFGFVAPHAGYIYSGEVAAYTYKALEARSKSKKIDTFVMIGPNHTGFGAPLAISMQDWHTPFGVVENDTELALAISKKTPYVTLDEVAHSGEHSIEVQLPFLQRTISKPRCVFICMGNQKLEFSKLLSEAIAKSAKELRREIIIIASSDFNHYESEEVAKSKDLPAIDALEKLDYVKFNKKLEEKEDTACGYGPITVAAMFSKEKGAKKGYLLKYGNSGEANKDYSSVVAYASIIFA